MGMLDHASASSLQQLLGPQEQGHALKSKARQSWYALLRVAASTDALLCCFLYLEIMIMCYMREKALHIAALTLL